MKLILASQSPRRVELLRSRGLSFETAPANTDESFDPDSAPEDAAREIARGKAEAVARRFPNDLILGADTSIWLDGNLFGKPVDRSDAIRMLSELSGKTHEVVTGIAAVFDGRVETAVETAQVTFAPFSAEEIARYVDERRPYDKAGAYGLQELDSSRYTLFGNADTVIGLPVDLTLRLLRRICRKEPI